MAKVEVEKRGVHHINAHEIFDGVFSFIKKNVVLCVALLAAIVTMFLVPPDKEYLGYFDVKTLTCLFAF